MSTRHDLLSTAREFALRPSDVKVMETFFDRLSRETSVEEISKILSIDYERIAGHALMRISELLPQPDPNLLLTIAFWHYHFGMDQEAYKLLAVAKAVEPFSLSVLQAEIYFSYGQSADHVLTLCNNALKFFPEDDWIRSVKEKIDASGQLTEMHGPPLRSKWHELCLAKG